MDKDVPNVVREERVSQVMQEVLLAYTYFAAAHYYDSFWLLKKLL